MTKPRDPNEAAKWARYRQSGDSTELQEHYVPWCWEQAIRLASTLIGIEPGELVGSAIEGLQQAIASYDPGRKIFFTTFSLLRIRGAMLDHIRTIDRVPRLVRSAARRVATLRQRVETQLQRHVSEQDLIDQSGGDLRTAKDLQSARIPSLQSLSQVTGATDHQDYTLAGILRDPRQPDPSIRLRQMDALRTICKGLSKPERLILLLYYWERMTMKEIGTALDLSESRVSQMHTALIERLRHTLQEHVDDLRT